MEYLKETKDNDRVGAVGRTSRAAIFYESGDGLNARMPTHPFFRRQLWNNHSHDKT